LARSSGQYYSAGEQRAAAARLFHETVALRNRSACSKEQLLKMQPRSWVAGLALGAIVLGGAGIGVASAFNTPRPAVSRSAKAAQVDIGRMAPLAGLSSYHYTLDLRVTGGEARLTLEDYDYLGLPVSNEFVMSAKGVVVGSNAQTAFTVNGAKEVDWRSGNRFESKVNGDPIEKWAGPFEDGDFDDTSLYAAQQYWDEDLMPWFEANRSAFVCSVALLPLGGEVRECSFDGHDESAHYDLLDAVSYGSFDEVTKLEVRASFSAKSNAPASVSIVAVGSDELGGATSLELTMKVSDINASLGLPPAPSAQ
jgi:hypothetical protein